MLPAQIYVIRHGEKPGGAGSPGVGVDINGNKDAHGLVPRGWQRAGALTTLFAPAVGPPRPGLRTPSALYAPDYGNQEVTRLHRTYQTIEGLSDLLGAPINTPCAEGEDAALAAVVLADASGVALICWDHRHIPAVGAALPTVPGTQFPAWPDDRFDVIWSFILTAATPVQYVFSQIPQRVLAGDADTVF